MENLLTVARGAGRFARMRSSRIALLFESNLLLHYQVKGVRRKAKFISIKIMPNTSSRGITLVPKLPARPTIHSRIATVKIVQNTRPLLYQ